MMFERYVIVATILVALLAGLGYLTYRRRRPVLSLDKWFLVRFDDERVTLSARPPDGPPWEQSFKWSEVTRVCYKAEGALASDGVYVFTTQRPESFVIPVEAAGGAECWAEIVRRGLFPSSLAIKVASSSEEQLKCWPAIEA